MDILSTIERATALFVALITALGGWEGVKYLINRKNNKRITEAEADSSEFDVLAKTNAFLQDQLLAKEQRFAEQTDRLRKLQDEHFKLMKEKAQTELDLQKYKCVIRKCCNREPQNGY